MAVVEAEGTIAAAAAHPRAAELRETTGRIAREIVGTCELDRTDRLCPAHFQVFSTNPMNLAFGAAGVALFLDRALGEVPEPIARWMLDQPLENGTYPPGLFVGLAGVAYGFAETGRLDKADEVMRTAYRSPLLYEEPGVFLGVAGWGWVALQLWARTGEQLHLDHAVRAGEHLLRTAEGEGEHRFWRTGMDGKIHYGYGYGASGIALFLLHLGLATGRAEFVAHARGGVDFDLANKLDTVNGTAWKRYEDDSINYPYFVHGSAGIGAVVVRFADLLGEERYWEAAADIAEGVDMKWTVFPSMMNGMSGIGEFNVDMYRYTGDERYLERAHDQAETILWFGVPTEHGLAFPGRMLMKICHDWGTGSAGVGAYLHRLADPGSRLLLDFEHPARAY